MINVNSFRCSLSALALTAFCATFAIAGEPAAEKTTIKLVNQNQTSTFNADDLQVGETRELVSDDGRTIVVSRTDSGIDIDDGTDLTQVKLLSSGDDLQSIDAEGDGGVPHRIEIRKVKQVGDAETADGGENHAAVLVSEGGKVTELDKHGAVRADASSAVVLGDKRIVVIKHGDMGEPGGNSRLIVIDRSDADHKKVMVEIKLSESLHEAHDNH